VKLEAFDWLRRAEQRRSVWVGLGELERVRVATEGKGRWPRRLRAVRHGPRRQRRRCCLLLLLGLLGGTEGGERPDGLAPAVAEFPEAGDPGPVLIWRDVQVETDAGEELTCASR
jgi:hypothetical protein